MLPTDPLLHSKYCSRSRKGLAPREIFSREIWERFQLIDISTVWQPESNYLKRAKSGRKRVVKEMISGSLSLPFPLFLPANFSRAFYFRVFPTIWEPGTGYTSCHPVTPAWFSILILVNSKIFKLSLNLSLTHPVMLTEIFHDRSENLRGFVWKTMHAWLSGESVFLIQMLLIFGGRVIAIAPFEIYG